MTDRFTVRSEFENPTYGGDDGVEVMPARMDLVFVLLFVDEHRPRDVERVAVGVEVEEGEIDAAAGGRTEFQRGIMGMFGAVEKEIMGTTAQLRTSVTDIRRFI